MKIFPLFAAALTVALTVPALVWSSTASADPSPAVSCSCCAGEECTDCTCRDAGCPCDTGGECSCGCECCGDDGCQAATCPADGCDTAECCEDADHCDAAECGHSCQLN